MTAPTEISFPFRVDPSGAIAVESNPDQQVSNHLVSLVGTQPGERIMVASYGVPTLTNLFEPDDELIAQQLQTDISNAVQAWEPGVNIINVSIDQSIQVQGAVSLNVQYVRTTGSANTPADSSKVFTATILFNGDIR